MRVCCLGGGLSPQIQDDRPATPDGILAHGAILHRRRLLNCRGNAGIQARNIFDRLRAWPKTTYYAASGPCARASRWFYGIHWAGFAASSRACLCNSIRHSNEFASHN